MKTQNSPLLFNIVALTKQLIVAPSTHTNREALYETLEIVKKELQDFTIDEFESNKMKSLLVHNQKPHTKNFKLILNAHLDVIPAEKEQFKPVEKDGKLYGRGAYDMKAAAVVMIFVFKKLAKQLDYPLALQLVTDEETGGFNGTQYQIKQGVRSDFSISGDCGSNLRIITQAKGILWLKLHTSGAHAHGAYPWRGDNALWKLHHALTKLHERFPVPSDEAWVTTMNLAKIETKNVSYNHVPDQATAYIDFRFIPEDEKTIINTIKKTISPDVDVDIFFNNSPEYVESDNKFVKLLQETTSAFTKQNTKLESTHAPSDIRHYNEVHCVGVQFGPKGDHQHATNEWVDLKSLEEYYYILEQYLQKASSL